MSTPQHGHGQPQYRGDGWPQQPPAGYPPQGQYAYPTAPPAAPRRRKRRIFLWVFLAIQVIFLIWVITGAMTKTGPTTAQIAQGCYHHAWYPLFKSQADCVKHYGGALNDAGNTGKAIGVGLVIVFWVVVDVILGISYGVYKLATRR